MHSKARCCWACTRSSRPRCGGVRRSTAEAGRPTAAVRRSPGCGPPRANAARRRSGHNAPTMASWEELVDNGATVVADGAMGTMLMQNGLEFGDPPEVWNLEHPEIIRRVQRGYLEAGSQIILTNTFGGNRLRLELHGGEDRVDQLNRTAAVLARVEANAADHPAIVAGDI